MKYLDLTREQFSILKEASIIGPFQMLNLLKFKNSVEGKEISGEEQYKIYLKAAYPFFKESKAAIVYDGTAVMTVIGPQSNGEWDKMLIIEYPSKEAFINMLTNPDYPANQRALALEDSRLIMFSNNKKK